MFEVLKSTSGKSYTAVKGSQTAITYQGSDGSEITTPNYRMSGDEIERYAMQTSEYPGAYRARGVVR